ncbi:MAG: 30S ribosomal protein S2 [bacterium]
MVKIPSIMEMLKCGVHFGHQPCRWHPKMEQYIFGLRNGVHIIDLERTAQELEKTLKIVKALATEGKVVLFVGTKRQARTIVKEAAESCSMPYLVERWIGGLLTNFVEVRRRLRKYNELKDQFKTGEIEKYSKKERQMLKKKLEKMDKYLVGLADLKEMPDAIYVSDMRTSKTAIAEANRKDVPIVAISDSNTNPEKATYIIPANDDAVNSIKMMAMLMAEAVNEGRAEWEKKQMSIKVANTPIQTGKQERKALVKDQDV